MNHIRARGTLFFLFLLICAQAFSQKSLPRSTPEEQGVSSQGIIDFLDSAVTGRNEFHSFMFLRHGKVIAEGWWHPYRPDLRHTMYSCSKSFTATAVGLAVKEKRLTVNDKVISFFPDQLPDSISPNLRDLTIKDLLTMTAGQEPDPTFTVATDTNWVRRFFSVPVVNKPGSEFLYNSMATYMLSAIVQKVTGEKIFDYLTPRLFEPLGIDGADWETDPKGINVGGWGLRLKTEDMAKFGQLFLQGGKWEGRRILSKSWIKEASSMKIIQHPEYSQAKRDSSDWEQGYCYQMWRSRNNSYRGDGAFGQYILVLPEQDAVIAITSETPEMQDELNSVWKFLLPAMKKKKIKGNSEASLQLSRQLQSLVLPIPGNNNTSTLITEISGRNYSIEPNDNNIQSISLRFDNGLCEMTIKNDTGEHNISFARGRWHEGETTRHGPSLVESAKNNHEGLTPFKIAGEYYWRDDNKLELVLRYIESPHTETILCNFEGNRIRMESRNSFNPATTVYNGEIK